MQGTAEGPSDQLEWAADTLGSCHTRCRKRRSAQSLSTMVPVSAVPLDSHLAAGTLSTVPSASPLVAGELPAPVGAASDSHALQPEAEATLSLCAADENPLPTLSRPQLRTPDLPKGHQEANVPEQRQRKKRMTNSHQETVTTESLMSPWLHVPPSSRVEVVGLLRSAAEGYDPIGSIGRSDGSGLYEVPIGSGSRSDGSGPSDELLQSAAASLNESLSLEAGHDTQPLSAAGCGPLNAPALQSVAQDTGGMPNDLPEVPPSPGPVEQAAIGAGQGPAPTGPASASVGSVKRGWLATQPSGCNVEAKAEAGIESLSTRSVMRMCRPMTLLTHFHTCSHSGCGEPSP